jgi:hypothetical protein
MTTSNPTSNRDSASVSDQERQLACRYLDGEASPDEIARLERLLCESPAFAAHLVALAAVDSDLDLHHRRRPRPERVDGAPVPILSVRRRVTVATAWGLAAAAALLLVIRLRDGRTSVQPAAGLTAAAPEPALAPPPTGVLPVAPETDEPALPRCEGDLSAGTVREVVHAQDFEQSTHGYPTWEAGSVVPCPPGPARHNCLRSRRMVKYPERFGVTLGDWRRSFLSYSDDLVLSFDYWMGDTTSSENPPLQISIHSGRRETFAWDCVAAGRARWIHVALPLSALRSRSGGASLAASDGIDALHIIVPWYANDVFFIDNLAILAKARPTTPAPEVP